MRWNEVLSGRPWPRGQVDFAFTDCEVAELPGSETVFVVRPKPGRLWSDTDDHRQGGSSRAFTFDCANSIMSRAEWLEHFQEHIAYGQARAQGEFDGHASSVEAALTRVSDLPDDVAACECAICLEPF